MKNFLEKNYKIIVSLFVLIGFFLTIKLWMFGANFICGSSGWISLCVIPTFEYSWTNAGYISLGFLFISIVGLFLIKYTENKLIKIYISLFILLLGVFGKPLFYLVSPDFRFYDYGLSSYTDKEGNLTNMNLYLESMGKYCDNEIDNFKFKRVNRSDLCGGQYLYDFKTAEEYGKVFDYANKKNMWYLYKLTYSGAEKFGLEKIINVYRDDTFYAYIIYKRLLSDEIKKSLELSIKNQKIINLYNNYINSLNENQDSLIRDNSYDSRTYWLNYDKETFNKIKEIHEVNTKVF